MTVAYGSDTTSCFVAANQFDNMIVVSEGLILGHSQRAALLRAKFGSSRVEGGMGEGEIVLAIHSLLLCFPCHLSPDAIRYRIIFTFIRDSPFQRHLWSTASVYQDNHISLYATITEIPSY